MLQQGSALYIDDLPLGSPEQVKRLSINSARDLYNIQVALSTIEDSLKSVDGICLRLFVSATRYTRLLKIK